MTNLTCFWHPKLGYQNLSLDSPCPECDRPMGYPLVHPPVGDLQTYTVQHPIDRGFYSATYAAEQSVLQQLVCLKVIPRHIYALGGKNFAEECRQHAQVANGTQHLVNIRSAFDADVIFEGETIPVPCHVAVLDYVSGKSLRALLDHESPLSARSAAQIALDLLRLLQELEHKQVFHNDLHAGNIIIEELTPETERGGPETIDPLIRAVAVDMGSVRDNSRSDEPAQTADNHQVTRHLMQLALRVMPDPVNAEDIDYRLAVALNDIANFLKPDNLFTRSPNYDDLMAQIRAAFVAATSPWKAPTNGLPRFGDAFNAQTMRPWFVPRLLVDPDGDWQRRVESPGPLVITGMRGCGKTILLRSLQFHARASRVNPGSFPASNRAAATDLREDGYLGLYVSCNRLLDGLGKPDGDLHEPYTRLFLCYAREALQALRHLSEVAGRESVSPAAPGPIAELVADLVTNSDITGGEPIPMLERKIHRMLRSLESGDNTHTLSSHPAAAMPSLAAAICQCADIWSSSRVLFLLDDVSTRHLDENSIRNLLSTLMFLSESCAFKVTTEAQTLELVLKSPGLVEAARAGRDYESFDLAAAIYSKLRDDGGYAGREFVAEVLKLRADLLQSHPTATPLELLGDQPLVQIARHIAGSSESSPERKNVYHGMSALAAVCVGDIGDVISIYELILAKAGRIEAMPVSPRHQSSAFQEFCSRRLYQLSRRQGRLKQFADGFAKAAHDLLIQSAKRNPARLRDYASVYVRVTTGDTDRQLGQLRELMDAGVFVLTAGPDTPRTKTRDSDPLAQYTLTFRKLLGISSAIGLSQRDRFELSGEHLVEWLDNPKDSAETLKRNLAAPIVAPGTDASDIEADTSDEIDMTASDEESSTAPIDSSTPALFLNGTTPPPIRQTIRTSAVPTCPTITELDPDGLIDLGPQILVVGRGFEERAFISLNRILGAVVPSTTVLVTYPLDGHGTDISSLLEASGTRVETVDSQAQMRLPEQTAPALAVVDTTGLSKPFIFQSIRDLLTRDGRVLVVHTAAEHHYPLNEDVKARLDRASDQYEQLKACADILTGEQQPYEFVPLIDGDVDDGRRRVLLASSSAKHERLFSLLAEREYDHVEIMTPSDSSPRSMLANLAADVAARDFHSSNTRAIPSDDLETTMRVVGETYGQFYVESNFNFEVGLTGSKAQAIALAAASTVLKFAQVWYVKPNGFDIDRFTTGAGPTRLFLIEKD